MRIIWETRLCPTKRSGSYWALWLQSLPASRMCRNSTCLSRLDAGWLSVTTTQQGISDDWTECNAVIEEPFLPPLFTLLGRVSQSDPKRLKATQIEVLPVPRWWPVQAQVGRPLEQCLEDETGL